MSGQRIVVAGGGIAALESVLALHALARPDTHVVLVSPQEHFAYRAYEVAEPFGAPSSLALPIAEILAETAVTHRRVSVVGVDPGARTVALSSRDLLAYDGLIVAVGGTPFPAFAHGVTFDRPGEPHAFDEVLEDAGDRLIGRIAFVVPERSGWTLPAYDLALMLRSWARRRELELGISVITPEAAPLEMFGDRAAAEVLGVLERAGVAFAGSGDPVVVSDTAVLSAGHWHNADRIVSLPRLAGPRLPGLPCDWAGFISVGPSGAVPGCPDVYAIGDGAAHPRKQGGLAAQQADAAVRQLLTAMGRPVPPSGERGVLRGVLATPEGALFLQARPAPAGTEDSTASFVPLWEPPVKVHTRWLGPHLDGLIGRRTAAFAAGV